MGNSTPVSQNLYIFIETDKPYYNSGSTIEGVVFVDARHNFQFDALYIRIEGHEHCKWFEGSSKNRRKYEGDENFYVIEYMLQKYEGHLLSEGTYAYPFSIDLSQNIPGSFRSKGRDASIRYKIIAYFTNFIDHNQCQYEEQQLIIRQPFRQEITEYQGEITKNPFSCWCCSQGEVSLRVFFSRNVCYEGEHVRIQIEADNQSGKSNINCYIIKLIQYTFVAANNGAHRTYRTEIAQYQTQSGLLKGDITKSPYAVDFGVPNIKHQTAIGTLVANYYRLEVSTDIANISTDEPTIYAPLFILKKSFGNNSRQKDKRNLRSTMQNFKNVAKKKYFKAPQYWFRRNKNLSIMNFMPEDNMSSLVSPLASTERFPLQENQPEEENMRNKL